ncbi:MAG: glycosyltransferase [Gammaproteobacteria bacterium]|nr:glycosyltransferase [Gammaproteobacteria bacterium]
MALLYYRRYWCQYAGRMSSVLMLVGSLRSGGAEGQTVLLANEFAAAGLDVCLAVLDGSAPPAFTPSKRVDVVELGHGGWRGLCVALWRLRRLARQHTVLVGFLDLSNAMLCMLRRSGQRVVCNVRSAGIASGWIARLSFQLALTFTRNADVLVANAEAVRRFYVARGFRHDNFVVIGNGVDTQQFKPDGEAKTSLCEELGVDPEQPLIGFFARYRAEKRHDLCLQAFALADLDAIMVCAGSGVDSDNRDLVSAIEHLDLQHKVHLLGERSDMARLNAGVDMAISASDFEGTSNSLLEAMACGLPCVATDVGGSAELIGTGGLLVPANDALGLSNALKRLVGDPELRAVFASDALARVHAHYKKELSVRAHLAVVYGS